MLLKSSTVLASVIVVVSIVGCGSVTSPKTTRGTASSAAGMRVRVDAPRGVELWEAAPDRAAVCAAPCSVQLSPRGKRFEARVSDRPDSPAFSIPDTARGAVVRVEPGPKVLPGLAAVTGSVGGGVMVVGGALVLADLAGSDDLDGAAMGGGITAAIGSAVLAAGIVLAALSGTHVKIREATRQGTTVRF